MGNNYVCECHDSQFILDISNLVVITSSSESRTNGRALGVEEGGVGDRGDEEGREEGGGEWWGQRGEEGRREGGGGWWGSRRERGGQQRQDINRMVLNGRNQKLVRDRSESKVAYIATF